MSLSFCPKPANLCHIYVSNTKNVAPILYKCATCTKTETALFDTVIGSHHLISSWLRPKPANLPFITQIVFGYPVTMHKGTDRIDHARAPETIGIMP